MISSKNIRNVRDVLVLFESLSVSVSGTKLRFVWTLCASLLLSLNHSVLSLYECTRIYQSVLPWC